MTDTALRRWAATAVATVAAIAAVVSFMHIYTLSVKLGQPHLAASLMPLSVDGSIGAASAALLSAARHGSRSPRTAQGMLALGVIATLAANAYSGSGHGIAGMAIACWPAVAFVGSTEVALGMVRRSAIAEPDAVTEPVTLDVVSAASKPPLSLAWPVTETVKAADTKPVSKAATAKPRKRTAGRNAKRSPAERAAAIVAAEPGISGAELGRRLRMSERSGRRLLAGITMEQVTEGEAA